MLTVITPDGAFRARDQRKPDHFWADKEVVEDYLPKLGVYGFSVYMLLCYYSRSSTGRSWPSIKTLARTLAVSEPTVRKALEVLIQAGLVLAQSNSSTTKRGKKMYHQYTFTLTSVPKRKEQNDTTLVNVVDHPGKPDLPPLVNVVDPNNTNNNKTDITREYTLSDAAKASPTESAPKSVKVETANDLKAKSEDPNLPLTPDPPSPPPAVAAKAKKPKAPQKPSIDQPVKDAIAVHIQGVDKKMAGSLTGILSGLATGAWKKALSVTFLTADQYASVARSMPKFVEWYGRNCKDCTLPQSREAFENWYSKFVAETVGAGAKPEQATNDYIRIPHPDPNKAALGIGKTVHRSSEEAKRAIASGTG